MSLNIFKSLIISLVSACLFGAFIDQLVINKVMTNEISFDITFKNHDAIFTLMTENYQGSQYYYGRKFVKKNLKTFMTYKLPMTYSSKLIFGFGSVDGDVEIQNITINGFELKDNKYVINAISKIIGFSSIGINNESNIILKGKSDSCNLQLLGEKLGLVVYIHFIANVCLGLTIFLLVFLTAKFLNLNKKVFNNIMELILFLSFISFIVWNNAYIFIDANDEETKLIRFSKLCLSVTNNLWIIFVFLLSAKLVGFIKNALFRLLIILLFIPFIAIYIADYFSYQEFNTHIVIFDSAIFFDTSADASSIIKHFFVNPIHWVVVSFLISSLCFLWGCLTRVVDKSVGIIRCNCGVVSIELGLLLISICCYFIPYPNVEDKYLHDNLIKSNYIAWQSSKNFSDEFLKKLNYKYEIYETNSRSENQHKNVLLLVIESLTFSKSKYFSGIENKMPYLDSLAKDNISFMNYYSNGSNSLTGNYSIITNLPFIFNDKSNVLPSFFYDNTLAKIFNVNGYATRVFSAPKLVYGMDSIYRSSGFSSISDNKDPFYYGKPRYVFNGVSDDVLYANVIDNISKEHNSFFYMINTVTTHPPYLNPITKEHSFDAAIEYAENSLEEFVNNLNKINYFDNGILVILGDHRAMIPVSWEEKERYGDWIYARMPLVIIDKEYKNKVIKEHLSNSSLGSIIQYLVLPKVRMSREQGNPFLGIKELVIFNQYSKRNEVLIRYGDEINTVLKLAGDDSFLEQPSDDVLLNDRIMGYVAWLRKRVNN